MVELQKILEGIRDKYNFPIKNFGDYWGLDVDIKRENVSKRHQKVYVQSTKDRRTQKNILFVWSYIGEWDDEFEAFDLLKANYHSIYAKLAIQYVPKEDKDYLIVCSAILADSCSENELIYVLQEVSIGADKYEMDLIGKDVE